MAGPMKKRADISVDFSGVESGGGRAVPDGEYLIEVISIEEKESQEGNIYLAWKWKIVDGPYKGATLYDNTSLKPTALWRLKSLLECLGVDVPSGKLGLNLSEYKGKSLLAEVANETYQGKQKPRISSFLRGIAKATPASNGPKKGSAVTFDYEGEQMNGVITAVEGSKVIVQVEIDGAKEEWEMNSSDVTLA